MSVTDTDRAGERLTFRSYAKAHRQGHVVGLLPGGHPIPFGPYTLTQVGLFLGSLFGLYLTRALWMHLGLVGDVLVLFGVPVVLAFTERFVRPEGRSPLRTAVALAHYLSAPGGGRVRGRARPVHRRHHHRLRSTWPRRIFVRDLFPPPPPRPPHHGRRRPAPAGPTSTRTSAPASEPRLVSVDDLLGAIPGGGDEGRPRR